MLVLSSTGADIGLFFGIAPRDYAPAASFRLDSGFPLLVVAMALQLDEPRPPPAPPSSEGYLNNFQRLVEVRRLFFGRRSVEAGPLPALFIFLWQATPSSEGRSSTSLQMSSGSDLNFSGACALARRWRRCLASGHIARGLQEVPIKKLFVSLSVASCVLASHSCSWSHTTIAT